MTQVCVGLILQRVASSVRATCLNGHAPRPGRRQISRSLSRNASKGKAFVHSRSPTSVCFDEVRRKAPRKQERNLPPSHVPFPRSFESGTSVTRPMLFGLSRVLSLVGTDALPPSAPESRAKPEDAAVVALLSRAVSFPSNQYSRSTQFAETAAAQP